MADNINIQGIIYSPAEAAKLAVEAVEEAKSNRGRGLKTGIKALDRVLLPFQAGELITVLGYTSNYKSSFMNYLIGSAIDQCLSDEIIVKVTWEDSVEEETLKWISKDAQIPASHLSRGTVADWSLLMKSYKRRIVTPLWIVGHSTNQSKVARRARPRLTMDDVLEALEFISFQATDSDLKIRMIVLDYLQRIRPARSDGNTKREQMMEAVNKSKDLGIAFGCPVVLGVQAGRSVKTRSFQLPRLEDGQETSNIEQSSDKSISLWYAIKSEDEGAYIESLDVNVTKNLLVCGILKQKMEDAPITLPLYVEPSTNQIYGMVKGTQNE